MIYVLITNTSTSSSSKRKYVHAGVQTDSDPPEALPALCHDTSSASTSPDPESDEDGSYSSKGTRKRKQSTIPLSSQASKRAKCPTKLSITPKQSRRDSAGTVDANGNKPRSIYAPSPTPLQCSYVYPVALGPPRRPVDLRRAKGARIMPEDTTPSAPAEGENGETPMDVDTAHEKTHRCPITFSREFEMRRHIRTVHIAEEIRAVVEGRLPREQGTVIPDDWDGKTLLSKPTCAGCGTTFSRPDAVRRHQTEVNAKMENGVCLECPGPKVHIRRGPRKELFLPAPAPVPAPAPAPAVVHASAPAQIVAPEPIPAPPAPAPIMAPYPPAMMDAPLLAANIVPMVVPAPAPAMAPPVLAPMTIAPAPAPAMPIETPADPVPAPAETITVPVVVPLADALAPPTAPTGTDSQPPKAAGGRAGPAEGELESEDDM